MDDNFVKSSLKALGFNSNQIDCYITLVKLGRANAATIAKKSRVKRTTIYDNLNFLKQEGLVEEGFENNKRFFYVLSPDSLKKVLNTKIKNTTSLINYLQNNINLTYKKPQIQIFENESGFRKMHELSLIANKERTTYYIGDTSTIISILGEGYIQKYVARRVSAGIKNKVISTKQISSKPQLYSREKNRQNLREVKILTGEINLSSNFFVYDNTVWIISTPKEGFVIMIDNREFATTIKNLFKFLWGVAQEIQ